MSVPGTLWTLQSLECVGWELGKTYSLEAGELVEGALLPEVGAAPHTVLTVRWAGKDVHTPKGVGPLEPAC